MDIQFLLEKGPEDRVFMEVRLGEEPKPLTETQKVLIRIDVRARLALSNPSLYPDQRNAINALANSTQYALSIGNPLCISFAKELIALTDPLITPKKADQT